MPAAEMPKLEHTVTSVWPVLALLSDRACGPWMPLPAFASRELSAADKQALDREEELDYSRYTSTQSPSANGDDLYANFGSWSNLWRPINHFSRFRGHTRLEAVAFLGRENWKESDNSFEDVVFRIRRITTLDDTDEMFESVTDLTLEEWINEGRLCWQWGIHPTSSSWWSLLEQQMWPRDIDTCRQVMARLKHQMPNQAPVQWGPRDSGARAYLASSRVRDIATAPEENECIICTDPLVDDGPDAGRAVGLSCHDNHIFHEACILKWLDEQKMDAVGQQRRCPYCRTVLFERINPYSQPKDALSADEIREVSGLTMVSSSRWTKEMNLLAVTRYFAVEGNRHGAFFKLIPDHLQAVQGIFELLAELSPGVPANSLVSWDHTYNRTYEKLILHLRPFSVPGAAAMDREGLKQMLELVRKGKSSRASKEIQQRMDSDVSQHGYRQLDLGFNAEEPLSHRRARFYHFVMEDAEDRVAKRITISLQEEASRRNGRDDLFRRADVDHLSCAIHVMDERGSMRDHFTPDLEHYLEQLWGQICFERAECHRRDAQYSWDRWLLGNLSVTRALDRPKGFYAPMAALNCTRLDARTIPDEDLQPHVVFALHYARTHTQTGQTRSGHAFRGDWNPLWRPFPASGDVDAYIEEDADDSDYEPPEDEESDEDDDYLVYNDSGEAEDRYLLELGFDDDETFAIFTLRDIGSPHTQADRDRMIAAPYPTFEQYDAIMNNSASGHVMFTFPVPPPSIRRVMGLDLYMNWVHSRLITRYRTAEEYYQVVPTNHRPEVVEGRGVSGVRIHLPMVGTEGEQEEDDAIQQQADAFANPAANTALHHQALRQAIVAAAGGEEGADAIMADLGLIQDTPPFAQDDDMGTGEAAIPGPDDAERDAILASVVDLTNEPNEEDLVDPGYEAENLIAAGHDPYGLDPREVEAEDVDEMDLEE